MAPPLICMQILSLGFLYLFFSGPGCPCLAWDRWIPLDTQLRLRPQTQTGYKWRVMKRLLIFYVTCFIDAPHPPHQLPSSLYVFFMHTNTFTAMVTDLYTHVHVAPPCPLSVFLWYHIGIMTPRQWKGNTGFSLSLRALITVSEVLTVVLSGTSQPSTLPGLCASVTSSDT